MDTLHKPIKDASIKDASIKDASIKDAPIKNAPLKYTDKLCIYNEICSKNKLCGDCGMDQYDREHYEEAVENFNLDRKMSLKH